MNKKVIIHYDKNDNPYFIENNSNKIYFFEFRRNEELVFTYYLDRGSSVTFTDIDLRNTDITFKTIK